MRKIVLYPGGFKPFHDGHMSLLGQLASGNDIFGINEIRIIISNKKRGHIEAETTAWFLKHIDWSQLPFTVRYVICDMVSPIAYCYKLASDEFAGNQYNSYALLSSDKDGDNKRSVDFYKSYQEDGKYYNVAFQNHSFLIPKMVVEPLYYENRGDEYDGQPLSSTVIRNDIANEDFTKFRMSYYYMLSKGMVDDEILTQYWTKLST